MDGFTDSFEVNQGSDPLDRTSTPFALLAPSPLQNSNDRDGDGLPNAFETENNLDPDNPDTDGDNIPDGAEMLNGSDPEIAEVNTFADSDGDGLGNALEARYGSNPNNRDSDFDGLDDLYEILLSQDIGSPDTDRDGIVDGWDLSGGIQYFYRNATFQVEYPTSRSSGKN